MKNSWNIQAKSAKYQQPASEKHAEKATRKLGAKAGIIWRCNRVQHVAVKICYEYLLFLKIRYFSDYQPTASSTSHILNQWIAFRKKNDWSITSYFVSGIEKWKGDIREGFVMFI
jgi:hypothetical protein